MPRHRCCLRGHARCLRALRRRRKMRRGEMGGVTPSHARSPPCHAVICIRHKQRQRLEESAPARSFRVVIHCSSQRLHAVETPTSGVILVPIGDDASPMLSRVPRSAAAACCRVRVLSHLRQFTQLFECPCRCPVNVTDVHVLAIVLCGHVVERHTRAHPPVVAAVDA